MPDYAEITAIAADEDGGDRTLSPFSISFLNFACTFYAERRHVWENEGEPLNDAEWDTIQAGIAEAFYEVNNPVTLGIDLFTHSEATNVAGGGIAASTFTLIPFNTAHAQNAGNVAVSSGQFTIEPGRYLVNMWHTLRADAISREMCILTDLAGTGTFGVGRAGSFILNDQNTLHLTTLLNLPTQETLRFAAFSSDARVTDAFGQPANVIGYPEIYGEVVFTRLGDV